MRTATNWLLCETALASDGGVVVIEDAGTANVSDTYVHAEIAPAPEAVHRALWVHTMNVHECDVVGRRVYVRVLSGSDAGGLGVLAFDGHLNIASGIVATGELAARDLDWQMRHTLTDMVRSAWAAREAAGKNYPTAG